MSRSENVMPEVLAALIGDIERTAADLPPTPEAATWFLAVCLDCEPRLPQPFTDPEARTEWAGTHAEATGHRVLLDSEERG